MSVTEIQVGAVFLLKDRAVEIVRIEKGPEIIVRDFATGIEQSAQPDFLRVPPARVPTERKRPSIDVLSAADEEDFASAQRREKIVLEVLQSALPRSVAVPEIANRYALCERTLYRWLAAYQGVPNVATLLANRGGNPTGAKRLSEDAERIIGCVISELFLKRSPAKPEAVFQDVLRRCRGAGIKPPSRRSVLARILDLEPATVAFKQLGSREAKRRFGPVPGTLAVTDPLDGEAPPLFDGIQAAHRTRS